MGHDNWGWGRGSEHKFANECPIPLQSLDTMSNFLFLVFIDCLFVFVPDPCLSCLSRPLCRKRVFVGALRDRGTRGWPARMHTWAPTALRSAPPAPFLMPCAPSLPSPLARVRSDSCSTTTEKRRTRSFAVTAGTLPCAQNPRGEGRCWGVPHHPGTTLRLFLICAARRTSGRNEEIMLPFFLQEQAHAPPPLFFSSSFPTQDLGPRLRCAMSCTLVFLHRLFFYVRALSPHRNDGGHDAKSFSGPNQKHIKNKNFCFPHVHCSPQRC